MAYHDDFTNLGLRNVLALGVITLGRKSGAGPP